jgi:hypothetical protein
VPDFIDTKRIQFIFRQQAYMLHFDSVGLKCIDVLRHLQAPQKYGDWRTRRDSHDFNILVLVWHTAAAAPLWWDPEMV